MVSVGEIRGNASLSIALAVCVDRHYATSLFPLKAADCARI
jgi:hypothetical protein